MIDNPLNKTEMVYISEIKKGDTILMNDKMTTIGKKDIRFDSFTGYTILGNPFIETKRMVERVLFPRWHKGELAGYTSQI